MRKNTKKKVKSDKGSFIDKLRMYDYIASNLYKGSDIFAPREPLGMDEINIGFNTVSSNTYTTKYFIITKYPDWMYPNLIDTIRSNCLTRGVKINFYIYGQKHVIHWESEEMKNKMGVWKRYSENTEDDASVFEYRGKRDDILNKQRIINSWRYLNESELDYKRTLCKVSILIEVSGKLDESGKSLSYMKESIVELKKFCSSSDIEITELRVNLLDWMQSLGIFSLRNIKELNRRIPKQVVTDDILACLNSYKQGRIGKSGIPIGVDVYSKLVVMKDFLANKNDAENWLISAGTGGGKSLFIKDKILWLLSIGITVTIVDFEGDEYRDLAAYVKAGNPDDVVVISMGKGNTCYCDPMEIPDLTGDEDIDSSLKKEAMGYAMKIFKSIVKGADGEELNKWEQSVISTAIKDVYEEHLVTDDISTWKLSKGIRLREVYEKIGDEIRRLRYMDESMNNVKHVAAVDIRESCIPYFEEGESKSGTFKRPITVNNIHRAKLVVFSFGERGKTASEMDSTMTQLKQLSVANISNQMSNYCKYVKGTLNAKVWEEYQRWGEIKGSLEIIANCITGGRKRGDINFIITNDLNAILDDSNKTNTTIRQNITSYAIGYIKDRNIRNKFCSLLGYEDLLEPLELIANATGSDVDISKRGNKNTNSRYSKAFCVILDNNEKAVVKVQLPKVLLDTELYSTRKTKVKPVEE